QPANAPSARRGNDLVIARRAAPADALGPVRIDVVGADELRLPALETREQHHVRLAVALHQHHVARPGIGERHRLPAVTLQVARQVVHRRTGLAAIDQPRLLQAGRNEVGAVDVVRHPALHRQLVAVLEFAGVAADELLRDRGGAVAADTGATGDTLGA